MDPLTMELRRASQDDAAGIARVHVRSWRAAYRGIVPDAILDRLQVEERTARWEKILEETNEGEDAATYVASLDGRVVGFCSFSPSRDEGAGERTAEVGALYVDPEFWRQGVGAGLLLPTLERLRSRGWTEVTLWVFARNHQARGFYARYGFDADGPERKQDWAGGASVVRLRAPLLGHERSGG